MASHPVGDLDRLLAYREALGAHPGVGPFDRLLEAVGPTETIADVRSEMGELLPALVIRQRRPDDLACGSTIRLLDVVCRLSRRRRGGREGDGGPRDDARRENPEQLFGSLHVGFPSPGVNRLVIVRRESNTSRSMP